MSKVSNPNNNETAGKVIAAVGFLMILANALDYMLDWGDNLVPLLIIGLVLIAVGLDLSAKR